MTVINPSIPVVGQPNSTEEPKIVTALTQLVAAVNNVDSSQIVDGTLVAQDMNSAFAKDNVEPAFERYKTILTRAGRTGALTTGTFLLNFGGAVNIQDASAAFRVDPADRDSGSRTTKYRLRVLFITNATTPTSVTYQVGLCNVTAAGGGAGAVNLAVGTTKGSVSFGPSPAASSRFNNTTTDFTLTADDYAIFVVLGGANEPAASAVQIVAELQVRQV